MGTVLIALILGLAFSIERIISLTLAGGNTDKLMNDINGKLKGGDIDLSKSFVYEKFHAHGIYCIPRIKPFWRKR